MLGTQVQEVVSGTRVVSVWCFDTDSIALAAISNISWLSTDERQRALRFGTKLLSERYISSRVALRAVLGKLLGCEPARVSFQVGPYGKPSLYSFDKSWQFNLSHSSEALAIAISDGPDPIGIDIEETIASEDLINISRECFTAEEASEIENRRGLERVRSFYSTWVRKESCVKAFGHGLSLPLRSFRVSTDPDASVQSSVTLRELPGATPYALCDLRAWGDRFIGCVARRGVQPIHCQMNLPACFNELLNT